MQELSLDADPVEAPAPPTRTGASTLVTSPDEAADLRRRIASPVANLAQAEPELDIEPEPMPAPEAPMPPNPPRPMPPSRPVSVAATVPVSASGPTAVSIPVQVTLDGGTAHVNLHIRLELTLKIER